MQSKKDLMISYAEKFIGTPYIWGGSTPLDGFDCSGFVQEILCSVGLDPVGDQTAQGLYNLLSKTSQSCLPSQGAILFFGKSLDQITHVAIALDHLHMIEAGGGDSRTISVSAAAKAHAFVRVRPISKRGDLRVSLMPNF